MGVALPAASAPIRPATYGAQLIALLLAAFDGDRARCDAFLAVHAGLVPDAILKTTHRELVTPIVAERDELRAQRAVLVSAMADPSDEDPHAAAAHALVRQDAAAIADAVRAAPDTDAAMTQQRTERHLRDLYESIATVQSCAERFESECHALALLATHAHGEPCPIPVDLAAAHALRVHILTTALNVSSVPSRA